MGTSRVSEFKRQQIKKRKARRRRRVIAFFIIAALAAAFFIGHTADRKMRNGVPLLLQTDSRWSDIPYGSSTVGISGCAPTCLSMVAIALTENRDLTPDAVAQFSEENGYYVEGTGTSWELMSAGAKKLGLKSSELPLDQSFIARELESLHPIICSVGPGDFTYEGHFIVLTGYSDGMIYVNDPNSQLNSSRSWSYERLAPQINAMWVFK